MSIVVRHSPSNLTAEKYDAPLARYHAELVVPDGTAREIAVLKGIAAHYVMRSEDRRSLQVGQRELLTSLVKTLILVTMLVSSYLFTAMIRPEKF